MRRTRSRHVTEGLTRRSFIGMVAGGAAAGLLPIDTAQTTSRFVPTLLRDYVGRLCYNENPLGPSQAAIAAIQEQAAMGHRYHDWFADSLRDDLAAIHGVSSAQIVAGCGGTEMLRLAALALADPAGNVVAAYPSYGQFPSDCAFLGAEVRYADLDANHRVDLMAVALQIDGSTTAVCLTNPNNPTATVLTAKEIASFVETIPPDVYVVIDEAYHDYVHDPGYQSAIELVRQGRNVVVIRTFSKAYGMAGVRSGYAIGESTVISTLRSWQIFGTVSRLALEASRAALLDDQHVADTVALNDLAKEYCFSSFDGMGLTYIPSETNFFMVDVGEPAGPVAGELASRGILVRTGWGMPNHLRVSTGTMDEMESFIVALQEILGQSGGTETDPPKISALEGNFPNPWKGSTQIPFTLASPGHATLRIFDIRGRLVKTLFDGKPGIGRYTPVWDGRTDAGKSAASGSYFYRLEIGDVVQTRRMILAR